MRSSRRQPDVNSLCESVEASARRVFQFIRSLHKSYLIRRSSVTSALRLDAHMAALKRPKSPEAEFLIEGREFFENLRSRRVILPLVRHQVVEADPAVLADGSGRNLILVEQFHDVGPRHVEQVGRSLRGQFGLARYESFRDGCVRDLPIFFLYMRAPGQTLLERRGFSKRILVAIRIV